MGKKNDDEDKKMTTHEDLLREAEAAEKIAKQRLQEIADAEARRAAMHVVPPPADDTKK